MAIMRPPDRSHGLVTTIPSPLNHAAPSRRHFLRGAAAALVLLPGGIASLLERRGKSE